MKNINSLIHNAIKGLLVTCALCLVTYIIVPVSAYETFGEILGSKSTAPGQEKKLIIGEVEKVTGNNIFIDDKKKNEKTTAETTYQTKFVGQEKKALRLSQIKTKDLIAFVGTDSATLATDGARVKKALKVYIKSVDETKTTKRQAVQGIIMDLKGSTLTIAHQIQRDRTWTVTFNSLTSVKLKGAVNATVADLAVGQRVVVIGDTSETGGLMAVRIHVIPGKATGIFTKQPLPTQVPNLTVTPSTLLTPTGSLSGTPTPVEGLTGTPTVILTTTPTVMPTATPTTSPVTPTPTI